MEGVKNMDKKKGFIRINFEPIRETSWMTILLFLVLVVISSLFFNLVVFQYRLFVPITKITFGIINSTLLANIINMLVIVGILMIYYGKLRLRDIGINVDKIYKGVIATFSFWVIIQIVGLITNLYTYGKIVIHHSWAQYGITSILGALIAQLLGNALYEEMAFRGFLLNQFIKKLEHKFVNKKGLTIFLGVLISQLIFALIHIPNRIYLGVSFSDIAMNIPILLGIGSFFALLYHRTNNLFIVIGLHSLVNTPTHLFEVQDYTSSFYYILAILLIFIWPLIERLTTKQITDESISLH